MFRKILVNKMKITRLYKYVHDISINYDSIYVDGFLDIHKYLIKCHGTKKCLDLIFK